jgi:hypothetical protein
MGAVSFSLDTRLVERLKQALPLAVLVETGTFKGDTVAAVLPYVERVFTIEQSEALWRECAARFAGDARVQVVHGDSAIEIARAMPSIGPRATLFWLDAHWCVADHTSGEHSQCPLLREIDAIGRLDEASVVLIDDARLFLAPPPEPHDVTQWPSFDAIVRALARLSDHHKLMVVNDVIAFYPPAAHEAITAYAREHGLDWLRASQSLEENSGLRQTMEEKEEVLHELDAALHARLEELASRDQALREKEQALQEGHLAQQEKEQALQEAHRVLQELRAAAAEKDAILRKLGDELVAKEEHIRRADADLVAKERVIQQLRVVCAPILAVGSAARPLRRALRLPRGVIAAFAVPARFARAQLRDARRMLRPRLGVLYQHPPIALALPRPVHSTVEELPSIALVTPSFGQATFIGRTIDSVLAQAYPRLEYFVQDGGSDDGTVEVLRGYGDRITGWASEADSGQSQAINRGFARTSAEIMGWLNSDDVLLPGALAAVGTFFARHADVDVVYGHRVLIDENDAEIGRWIMPPHDDQVLSWADFVPQETLFWRRRIWDKAGGRIDESFRFAMDWDLIVRFRDAGARFHRLPRFIGGFRIHPHQKTSAVINQVGFQEMNRIRERALGRIPSGTEVRRAVAPYILRHTASDLGWRIARRLGLAP